MNETEIIQELIEAIKSPKKRKDAVEKAQFYLDSVKFQQQSKQQKQDFLKERKKVAEQIWKDATHPDNINGVYAWIMGDNCWRRQFTYSTKDILQIGWFFVVFKPYSNIVCRFGHEKDT